MDSERNDNTLLLNLEEDLTASSVEGVKDTILGQLDDKLDSVELNLAKVEMVDSTGISLLISIQNSLKKNSGNLSLKNTSEDIVHMFKLMRLDRYFQVYPR